MRNVTYIIHKVEKNIVFLIDPDQGDMTITNNAERVCEEINKLYPAYRIVYRDTMGYWDELIHDNGCFLRFGPYDNAPFLPN